MEAQGSEQAGTEDGEKPAESEADIKRAETLEKIVEEDESREGHAQSRLTASTTKPASSAPDVLKEVSDKAVMGTESTTVASEDQISPLSGPEVEEFQRHTRENVEKLKILQNAISSYIGNDPSTIEINKPVKDVEPKGHEHPHADEKGFDEVFLEANLAIEKPFKYRAVEFDGADEEEGEEEEEIDDGDDEGEEEEDEEGEEEEEDPSLKTKKIQFGDTSVYCPVSLYKRNVLVPGNPEIKCKYREKIYRFASEEYRTLFLETPDVFLSSKKPPTVNYLF